MKSRVVLTGIIDHPSNLRAMTNLFLKVLVWILKRKPHTVPEQYKLLAISDANVMRWVLMTRQCVEEEFLEKFPREWYDWLCQHQPQDPASDPAALLAVACYNIVEVYGKKRKSGHSTQGLSGLNVVLAGPKHILEVFEGGIPSSPEAKWLQDAALKALVLRAYRYAFKLIFDQASLGEFEDYSELEVQ